MTLLPPSCPMELRRALFGGERSRRNCSNPKNSARILPREIKSRTSACFSPSARALPAGPSLCLSPRSFKLAQTHLSNRLLLLVALLLRTEPRANGGVRVLSVEPEKSGPLRGSKVVSIPLLLCSRPRHMFSISPSSISSRRKRRGDAQKGDGISRNSYRKATDEK